MSQKKSPLWDYFEEDKDDYSFAICKVADCGVKISRGRTGTSRAGIGNFGMRSHLKVHGEQFLEMRKKETDKVMKMFLEPQSKIRRGFLSITALK